MMSNKSEKEMILSGEKSFWEGRKIIPGEGRASLGY